MNNMVRKNDIGDFFNFWPNMGMKTDVKENGDDFVFEVELPGVSKEDISIEYEKGNIVVTAKRQGDKEEKHGSYIRKERFEGTCRRNFYVGENIDEENISAKFENGILNLTVPKKIKDEEKVKKIAID